MKFSIIIPAHNAEKHIENALISITSQDFTDYELIVICDKCEDKTEELAKSYGAITKSVSYGLDGLTRNEGINMAQGEWVLFMDDDDWWVDENVLSILNEKVGTSNEDVLCFNFFWKGKGETRQTPQRQYTAVWNKCWRRAFLGEDIRFSNRPYWSDMDFERKVKQKRPKMAFLNKTLYYYNYMRPGSISQREAAREIPSYWQQGREWRG